MTRIAHCCCGSLRAETTRHPWVTFDYQLDRFTVQPKIDLDGKGPSHGAANDHTSTA